MARIEEAVPAAAVAGMRYDASDADAGQRTPLAGKPLIIGQIVLSD
jgi:hypothetical protein